MYQYLSLRLSGVKLTTPADLPDSFPPDPVPGLRGILSCMQGDHQRQALRWKGIGAAFLSGQAVSILGSGLVQFAIIWFVTLRANSGTALMIITLTSFIPQLVVAPFAGVWADRHDRRWLIILADSAIALVTLAMALLFLFGYDRVWMIYIAAAIRSLGGGIQSPAIKALIPQITPKSELVRINGIYSTIENIPEYVLDNHHGDCGQVSLLFITLCRCSGIPAHFQSGFMMHPGAWNLHDWAEIYLEGIGWVPVDQSFGISAKLRAWRLDTSPGSPEFDAKTEEGPITRASTMVKIRIFLNNDPSLFKLRASSGQR